MSQEFEWLERYFDFPQPQGQSYSVNRLSVPLEYYNNFASTKTPSLSYSLKTGKFELTNPSS
ncbi:MAG: hypothetical protein LEGION0403_FIIPPAGN_00101 [Legionella sp.]